MDVVRAVKTENTKCAKDPARRRGVINFRSERHTPCETLRLDPAQFPEGKTLYTLAIDCFRVVPEPDRSRPRAHAFFKGGMQALGPVEIRDRRWLIDRLTTDYYQMREAKLQWDKHRGAFALYVCFAYPVPADPDPDFRCKRVVALDIRGGAVARPIGDRDRRGLHHPDLRGRCGVRNPDVGRAETFRCGAPGCGARIDRDVNGARNIALRVLTDRN